MKRLASMMRTRHRMGSDLRSTGLLAIGLCFLATSAQSAPIPVNNASFGALPDSGLTLGCGAGCSYSEDFIPGWTNIPFGGLGLTSGQFRPGTEAGNTTYFDALSDGPVSAYTTIGCITQTVGVAVQEGVTYTLSVDVGWRKDAAPFGLPRLFVNGVYYDGAGTPVFGDWATFTATYLGQAADVGMPITICLTSVTFQGNFDNVRLDDSIVPTGVEPSGPPVGLDLDARPNPFGTVARVRYSIPESSPVDLRVYDASGRVVRTLLRGTASVGSHEAIWDGSDDAGARMESGVYFLRLSTNEESQTSRVVLVR
ncbi:MAG: FlgD immunoglobulin-like domain containing protein [bacterium]